MENIYFGERSIFFCQPNIYAQGEAVGESLFHAVEVAGDTQMIVVKNRFNLQHICYIDTI